MSEAVMIAIMSAEGSLIVLLVGWLLAHERRCSDRWLRHMQDYGQARAQLDVAIRELANSRTHSHPKEGV